MVGMIKEKSCYVSILISLLNVFEENPKNHFRGMREWRHEANEGLLFLLQGKDQTINRMVENMGKEGPIFYLFAGVVNEWPTAYSLFMQPSPRVSSRASQWYPLKAQQQLIILIKQISGYLSSVSRVMSWLLPVFWKAKANTLKN